MQNRKPPAYQEYAANILVRLPFRTMTLQDRGLLYTMRLECWVNMHLPHNHDSLAKVLGLSVEEVSKSLGAVMPFFDLQNGFIICPELENYRADLAERRRKQSQGGKRGSTTTNNKHKRSAKNVERLVTGTLPSTSRLPRQGSNESLVQSSTEQPSQIQSIKKEVVSLNDTFVEDMEAYEKNSKGY